LLLRLTAEDSKHHTKPASRPPLHAVVRRGLHISTISFLFCFFDYKYSYRSDRHFATFDFWFRIVTTYCLYRTELGHIELTKLSPQHVQKYTNGRLESGLSAKTVKYELSVLRMSLGQALKWNLVARNVARLVDPPRLQKFEVQPISPEQARKLMQAVQGDRLEALFTVALSLGLRGGEALGLR
jgi:integrase